MQATRYRLRFTPGIATEAVTYGSASYGNGNYGAAATADLRGYGQGLFGDDTYGQGQTFPTRLAYELIPWTGGYPTAPSWIYRIGDTRPDFNAVIFGDGQPVDVTDVGGVQLVLTPIDGRGRNRDDQLAFNAARVPGIIGRVTYVWQDGDLATAGVYRACVRLVFPTGHVVSVPATDTHTFVVNEARIYPEPARRYGQDLYGSGAYGGIHIHPPFPPVGGINDQLVNPADATRRHAAPVRRHR